jgi:hypothetical protein
MRNTFSWVKLAAAMQKGTTMTGNVLTKARSFLVRGMAVVAVLATYAASTVTTQVATSLGLTALTLTATSTPANAWWRRGYGWGWRRGWGYRRWRRW